MAPSGGGGEYPAGVGHRGGGHRRSDRADHQHRRGLPGEKTGLFMKSNFLQLIFERKKYVFRYKRLTAEKYKLSFTSHVFRAKN